MHWYNEPSTWTTDDTTITIQSEPETDFWRITHSGFIGDNGHFYAQRQTGDLQAEVRLSGEYNALYDQAGLMVRVDEATWVKCGIEYIEGAQKVSAVVTREFSDWSMVSLPSNPAALWLRLIRRGITIEIQYSLDGSTYDLLRQAYLTSAESVEIGVMAASPTGKGFRATFEGLSIKSL
jgi:regulation of enolase protein 1 (concanavalin A-like superfamily)